MRGALIHGVLLAVMLVYGYRTWTRDKSAQPDHGAVVLWDKTESDLVSVELKTDKKIVKLERRTAGADTYWWGVDTTIEKHPKKPADAGSGAGSGSDAGSAAGSGSGSGSGSAAVEMEETRKTKEFPLGPAGDTLLGLLSGAHALREVGTPSDEQKKEFKLDDAKSTLTIALKDGTHTFLLGGSPFAGDRYAQDQASSKVYVLSKDMISPLEVGEVSLKLADPRGFDATKLEQVTIEAGGKSRSVARIQTTSSEGQSVKAWGDPETKKADQTIANFIDNANNLRPSEYQPDVQVSALTPIVKLSYRDEKGRPLGAIQLFKRDKPGELPPGVTPDPNNPVKPVTEYFILSEKTRVPGLLPRATAERTEQDVPVVFGDHPLELPPKAPGNPHGGFKPGAGPLPPVPTPPTPAPAGTSAPKTAPVQPTPAPNVPTPNAPVPPAAPKAAPPATPAPAAGSSSHP